MTVISASISDNLNKHLRFVAKELKRSKSFLIEEALSKYIQNILEDMEDAKEAERILDQNYLSYSLESVIDELAGEDLKK